MICPPTTGRTIKTVEPRRREHALTAATITHTLKADRRRVVAMAQQRRND